MMTTNTISTHPKDDSVGTFRNSVALLWPLWLEGRCHASNVEVVARDLFTTPAMALRWTAAGMMEAAKGFRRLKAYKHLPVLRAALAAHQSKYVTQRVEHDADAA